MTRRNGTERRGGFTLVELLVVIGMIALIIGSLTTSVTAAQTRARIQKATSDVHVISQAIHAYANYQDGDLSRIKDLNDENADSGTLNFLLGEGGTSKGSSQKIPALLMAALRDDKMLDPWGHPYKIKIRKLTGSNSGGTLGAMQTGYMLPNFYRLGKGDRNL